MCGNIKLFLANHDHTLISTIFPRNQVDDIMENQEQRPSRLVLVPGPFQGHLTPMLQLGTILHSKGFSITIAHTRLASLDQSTHPEFEFLHIEDGLTEAEAQSINVIALVLILNVNCEAKLMKSLTRGDLDKGDNIICIIYDALMYFALAVAKQLKLPSMVLNTSSPTTMLARLRFPHLMEEGYIPLQDSLLRDMVPDLNPLRFKDLPISSFGKLEEFMQLLKLALDIKASSAVILNTVEVLEASSIERLWQMFSIPIFPIGPLHRLAPTSSSSLLEEDVTCISWLDKQRKNSVLYISLGSLAHMKKDQVLEMAQGLAQSKHPFLWVIRPGLIPELESIESLDEDFHSIVKERGCIVKWAPQKKVLAHEAVGGFWSHCGWNSTLESLCEGVPMICQPCFGDQTVNARYLAYVWRVGLEIDEDEDGIIERGKIQRAIERLMSGKDGEEMRQRALMLRDQIELSIGIGGSSYNSIEELVKFILSM